MKTYLAHIDGLRGLAIILVVLFHNFGLKGGFIGVDVFFVISGFLITRLIVQDLEEKRFSLWEFYAKRSRRIFPSLLIVILGCLVFGWYALFTSDFQLLGKHATSGALFFSNLTLLFESGYFDVASETKPFLHLWSLAIEEQFYLFWPAILLIAHKVWGRVDRVIIALVTLSFVANMIELVQSPARDFYMLHARLWELAVGGWLALRGQETSKNSRPWEILGLSLILGGSFFISASNQFPGWKAIVPVVGASLLVVYGRGGILLDNSLMRYVGKISFPLYLWHWPVISFFTLFNLDPPTKVEASVALLFSFVLAMATHYAVELPLKDLKVNAENAKRIMGLGLSGIASIAVLGVTIERGMTEGRLVGSPQIPYVLKEEWGGCSANTGEGRTFNPATYLPCEKIKFPNRPRIFLLGDSHASALYQGLIKFSDSKQLNLSHYATLYCTPLYLNDRNTPCREANSYILGKIKSTKPDLVIIHLYYKYWSTYPNYDSQVPYTEFIARQAQRFLDEGAKKVLIIGQVPTWRHSPAKILNLNFIRKEKPIPEMTFDGLETLSLEFDEMIKPHLTSDKIHFFSVKDTLCQKDKGCLVRVGDRLPEELIAFDYGHLTLRGADYMAKKVGAKLEEILK